MILCSTGALFRGGTVDAGIVARIAPQLPVDGLEVLVTRPMIGLLDEIGAALADVPVPFPVVHAPKRSGAPLPSPEAVEVLEESAEFARRIGATVVVLHLWDGPESDANFAGRLEAAVIAADIFAGRNLAMAVETIPCSYGSPLRNIERVLAHEPRAAVALDTEFLAVHDELDDAIAADWLWSRVRHIHLKDYDGSLVDSSGTRRYLDPGQGGIDFPAFFDALRERTYAGAVSLESGPHHVDGRPNLASLARVVARMSSRPWSFSLPRENRA